jgi:predicted O-methyltransferase YrrM
MFATKSEELFFFSHIDKTKNVLEYGCGYSTIEIANNCKKLVSVEHQENWYNDISNKIPNNCTLLYSPSDLEYTEGGDDGTYEEFYTYVNSPVNHGPFDIILIDGRARVSCSSICNILGNENTIVFIHDFFRPEYKKALEFLELLDSVETMSKFKIKY